MRLWISDDPGRHRLCDCFLEQKRAKRILYRLSDCPTIGNWFDKAAFTLPANFAYGNSGAAILREANFKSLNFSIFKQFRVGERGELQFRAEAFNLTNTPSFSAPGTNIDVASGGIVLSTISTPRQIQFALKLLF